VEGRSDGERSRRRRRRVSSYAVAWIITILGIALLGEATRRGGEGFGSHAIGLFVVFVGMAFLGGVVGGLIASSF
jgi:hypothetical protein